MRLWHKDLIPYLPQKQLVAQWRELCCIAKNIATDGTPNHLLVNNVLKYSIDNIYKYVDLVRDEMIKRGYNVTKESYIQCVMNLKQGRYNFSNRIDTGDFLFNDWMGDRYLLQCYYNLQEKYDCGGITDKEWDVVFNFVKEKLKDKMVLEEFY